MTKPFCFSGNQILAADTAAIHPLDIGLIRGYAIFEFFRVDDFKPFFLEDYLNRFIASAKHTHLPLAYGIEELKNIVFELIEKNHLEQGGVRMVLTGGLSDNHFSPTTGSLFIFCEELQMPAQEKYEKGVKLVSEEYVRPLPSIKTTNYTLPVWLSAQWKEQNAEDVIYHFAGVISESSRSNIFMVKNGVLATPKSNILHGITRKNVIQIAEEVEERDITLTEILNADEVFMTATTKRILPVSQIDVTLIRDGLPGPVTRQLMEKFRQLEMKEKADR